MIINHRHLLQVLQQEIDKIDEVGRTPQYGRHLKEHLSTVLAHEREHRVRPTSVKDKVRAQVEALASSLNDSDWQPGGGE